MDNQEAKNIVRSRMNQILDENDELNRLVWSSKDTHVHQLYEELLQRLALAELKLAGIVRATANPVTDLIDYHAAWDDLVARLRDMHEDAGDIESEPEHRVLHDIIDNVIPSVLEKQINRNAYGI